MLNEKIMMATAMMTGAFGSYLHTANGELFMMDDPDPSIAKIVWRWNVNGFAKSSSGIDGPYTTALTFNDEFITGVITAMVVNATVVKTGVLQSVDGETFYLDLDKGILRMKATELSIGGKSFSEATSEQVQGVIDQYLGEGFTELVDEIKQQADQMAETWMQATDPSLEWPDEEKPKHKRDFWYNTTDGHIYLYDGENWADVTGTVPEEVFDKIDGKAKIFVAQPYAPYHVGDLWFAGPNGEIMTCVQARESGDFAADDWGKLNFYTDDSYAKQVQKEVSEVSERVFSIEASTEGIELRVSKVESTVEELGERERALTMQIESSNGNVFKNGEISTTLTAYVYEGATDVSERYDANLYEWRRVSKDPEGDKQWTDACANGRRVDVTGADVEVRATFFCDLVDPVTRLSLLNQTGR